jgi:hypothetical protein
MGPNLGRSVQGFHSVQVYSRVFQAPSYYSPGPPRQWGEQCPGLPLWNDEADELAPPTTAYGA